MLRDVEGDPARTHVTVNIALMFAMAFLHLATLGSVALNLLGMAVKLPWLPPAHDAAELTGQLIAFAVMGLSGAAGLVWAPVNAFGLIRDKPWARKSTVAYWAFAGVFCCCLPGAAYGLWSLTRDDVKARLGT